MPCPPREAFQIGWICALPIEAAAAREMLDEIFDILDFKDSTDLNTYTLGRIGKHNVVIACLPTGQYGTTLATTVANNMARMFSRSLRIGLIVGIGAGIPSATHDIRLGDIVISYPEGTCGGVLQYDLGKVGVGGVFRRTGSFNSPPRSLLAAVSMIRAAELTDDPRYPEYLISAIGRTARTRKIFARPDAQYDRLFKLEHDHPPNASSCDTCLPEWEEIRSKREDNNPQSHYGIVASGNTVIKNPRTREQLRLETGALCFEMEAAGLSSDFPCIFIRGICDYADSHKNKQWQGYAALAAASYAKELLGYVPESHVLQENLVVEVYNKLQEEIEGVNKRLNRAYDQQEQHHNERGNPPNVDYENKDYTNSSDFGDQTDVESIFSTESISSWESEITSTAISELARLLLDDDQLMGLYLTAISKVGPERFQRNFSRMLKRYGWGLNREASNEIQREAAHFVRLSARRTAIEVRINFMENNPELFFEKKPEAGRLELARVNEWIESHTGDRTDRNADGDESSVDSDPSDSESTTLATLEKVKEFLVSTHAFLDLRHEFQQWLEGKKRDGHGTQSEKKDTDYLGIQDGCQVMEARKQVLAPEHSDTPDLSSGAVGHDMQPLPDFVDFGDSDSSNENDSVFSAPVSLPSTESLESGRGEINSLLVREFASLLHEDGVVLSLLLVGVSKELIGFEKMRNNFRRLLKHFAGNLKADILNESHRDLRGFVSSYSAMITSQLFAMTPIVEERNTEPPVPEAEYRIASLEKRPVHKRKVEDYLQNLHWGRPTPQTSEATEVFNLDDEESDQDSVAEEAGEDEPYEGSLQHLDQMRHFILESSAYQILRRKLEEFVKPSLYSRLRDLVTRWSTPEHKNHGDAARYKLRNLVTELQHVSPHEIQFEHDQNIFRTVRFISHYQHIVERWTGERWDWWPLPSCLRPLGESETRLRWKCPCGEERWAEVPNTFVKRLQSIIRRLSMDTTATKNTQLPPEAHIRSNPTSCSTPNNSLVSNRITNLDHGRQQPGGSSSNPSPHRRPSGLKANIVDMSITRHRILFLAKQGGDYRLAQICVSNLNCHTFFSIMKKEYFRLRGVLRGCFSVWRYSHCDFYKFEKFDDHEFALKIKDSFPDHANTDYEYQPRPMDNIPPISEHEFKKRFYACYKPRPLLHLHHRCRRLGAHSSDILKFLPKKRTELEEAGDKREDFWGIYAREIISLRWIIFYNFVCVSPLLAFFVAWIVPQGHGTDLQNPSIPLSIMGSMLSLFWSIFLSSLQFGRSH